MLFQATVHFKALLRTSSRSMIQIGGSNAAAIGSATEYNQVGPSIAVSGFMFPLEQLRTTARTIIYEGLILL